MTHHLGMPPAALFLCAAKERGERNAAGEASPDPSVLVRPDSLTVRRRMVRSSALSFAAALRYLAEPPASHREAAGAASPDREPPWHQDRDLRQRYTIAAADTAPSPSCHCEEPVRRLVTWQSASPVFSFSLWPRKKGTDCRVAALLAMTAVSLCVSPGPPRRRPLRPVA